MATKFVWGRFKSIDDLKELIRLHELESRINEKRKSFKILAIDDEEFTYLENLERHQFNITHVKDITAIAGVEPFQIILCDLVGVGKKLNPVLQGAHLIGEIKKNYPEKVAIAYTGGPNTDLMVSSLKVADSYIKKDASIDEWCNILDNSILQLANPVSVWKKYRVRLLDAGITPTELIYLENDFVTSFETGPNAFKGALQRRSESLGLGNEVKTLINSLAANALFSLLVN